MFELPGFVDIATPIHAGEWAMAFQTAVCSGYTALLAAPQEKVFFYEAQDVEDAYREPLEEPLCDFALIAGIAPENVRSMSEWQQSVPAVMAELKVPTKDDIFAQMTMQTKLFNRWPKEKPIVIRGEQLQIGSALFMAQANHKQIHISSVATRGELDLIREVRETGTKVTCDIHPLSLLLCSEELKGVCPLRRIGTAADRQALLDNLDIIDCFSSAAMLPLPEKPFIGLETMLPIVLDLLDKGIVDEKGIYERCYDNPRSIFGLYPQSETCMEVEDKTVQRLVLRGEPIYNRTHPVTTFRGKRLKGYRG